MTVRNSDWLMDKCIATFEDHVLPKPTTYRELAGDGLIQVAGVGFFNLRDQKFCKTPNALQVVGIG